MAACVDHTVHAKRHHHTLLFLRYPTQTQCTAASRLGDLHQQFQVHRDLKKKNTRRPTWRNISLVLACDRISMDMYRVPEKVPFVETLEL